MKTIHELNQELIKAGRPDLSDFLLDESDLIDKQPSRIPNFLGQEYRPDLSGFGGAGGLQYLMVWGKQGVGFHICCAWIGCYGCALTECSTYWYSMTCGLAPEDAGTRNRLETPAIIAIGEVSAGNAGSQARYILFLAKEYPSRLEFARNWLDLNDAKSGTPQDPWVNALDAYVKAAANAE